MHASTIIDPAGHHWQIEHDERGLLRHLKDPEGGGIILDWDVHCQLVGLSFGEQRHTWEYDTFGRAINHLASDSLSRSWRYNAAGTLVEAVIGTQVIELGCDPYGRFCSIAVGGDPQLQWQADGFSRIRHLQHRSGDIWTQNYNAQGKLISLHTNEQTYRWHYNEIGLLDSFDSAQGFQRKWLYDTYGRPTEFHDNDSHWYFQFSKQDKLEQARNNSGQLVSFHYDHLGRLVQASNEHSNLRYRYDKRNLVIAEHQDLIGDDTETNRNLCINHGYDCRGWLKHSASEQLSITYTFSAAGQLYGVDTNGTIAARLAQHDDNTKHIFLGENQLVYKFHDGILDRILLTQEERELELWHRETESRQRTHSSSNSETLDTTVSTRIQDARGNLLSDQRIANGQMAYYRYQYDGWGLLQSIECGDFKTWLRYDPLGRRLCKTSIHRRSRRQRRIGNHWCGTGLWSEYRVMNSSNLVMHYLHNPISSAPLARVSLDPLGASEKQTSKDTLPGSREFFVADDHGRILALLSDASVVASSRSAFARDTSLEDTRPEDTLPRDGLANNLMWKFDREGAPFCPGSFQGALGMIDAETQLVFRNHHYFHINDADLRSAATSYPLDIGLNQLPRPNIEMPDTGQLGDVTLSQPLPPKPAQAAKN
ncbi:hypothetical protein GCM10008940_12100 [Microbulbifer agarilyticus]